MMTGQKDKTKKCAHDVWKNIFADHSDGELYIL